MIVQKMKLIIFLKIDSLDTLNNYRIYTNEFDEIIKAEDLCDPKELDKLAIIIRSTSI